MATEFYNRNWRMPKSSNSSKVSNYSMQFNGTDEYVEISDSTLLNGKTAVTISMWINPSLQGLFDAPLNYYSFANGGNNKIGFAYSASTGNYLRFTLQTSSALAYVDSSTNSIPLNQWTHIVGVGEAGQALKFYINGIEDSATQSGTMPTLYQDANLFIGKDNGAATRNFNGKIDHVAIFDYALSASQVTSLYGNSTDGVGNPMAITGGRKPIAYYPIGDYAAFNGSEYLVPNGALQDYVFDFDGSNDYIDLASSSTAITDWTQPYTISMWINYTASLSFDLIATFGVETGSAATTRYIMIGGSSGYLFTGVGDTDGGSTNIHFNIGSGLNDGNWHNIVYIGDGTSGDFPTVYIDGVLETYSGGTTNLFNSSSYLNVIGTGSTGAGRYFTGKISNAQIFNTALSATGSNSVETLYNNGTPLSDMSGFTSLQGWWKLDASATFDGSNWSIPDDSSNSNTGTSVGMTAANLVQSTLNITTPYSRYALDFDGTNDYIDCGNDSTLNITSNLSVSVWFKTSNNGQMITKDNGLNGSRSFAFGVVSGKINATVRDQDGSPLLADTTQTDSTYNDGNWHHSLFVYEPSTSVKIYVDGNLVKTNTSSIVSKLTDNASTKLTIGAYQNGAFTEDFNGSLSNASIWNAALNQTQVTEIYNEGKPSNLNNHSAYSNLVSWWQLGENSSFDGTNWTVLDEKGTNNGTSANMTEADLVNGVGTSGNGISDSMGGADNIIGDAPYSTANAVSYGMGVDAKSTDVPS